MGNLERITANNSAIQECIDIANGLSGGSGGVTGGTSVISFTDYSPIATNYNLSVYYVDTDGTTRMQSITRALINLGISSASTVTVPKNYLVFIHDNNKLANMTLYGGEAIYKADYMFVFSPIDSEVTINIETESSSGSEGPDSGGPM